MLDQVAATATLALSRADAWLPHVAALIMLFVVAKILLSRWHTSLPNEWLMYLYNGSLIQAGVGESCFCQPGGVIVKFPSTMQEVNFTASQATRQRAGVAVSGKAYWSIYRPNPEDPDGPLRAFRSLAGLAGGDFTAGNEKVQTMAISTIRGALSNMTVVEVMTQRETLTKRVKQDITLVFRGWGIWLETVEILDVRVESKSLFDDMQYLKTDALDFDTKADAHLAAEKAPIAVKTALEGEKVSSSLAMAKKRADAASAPGIHEEEQSQGIHKAELSLRRPEPYTLNPKP